LVSQFAYPWIYGNLAQKFRLPPRALTLLRCHWQTHRNPVWLFPAYNDRPRLARTASAPFDVRGVPRAFQLAVQVSSVHKPASVHTLRHSWGRPFGRLVSASSDATYEQA